MGRPSGPPGRGRAGAGVTVILGIATATSQVSVALAGPDGLAGELRLRAGRRHGETLAPAIRALCELAGTTASPWTPGPACSPVYG
jgi:hypothetical protein